jgi:hypothetical protein
MSKPARVQSSRDAARQRLRAETFGPCPDCGRPLSVACKPDGSPKAVLHVAPTCDRFESLEADAFLTWVLDVREAERRPPVFA